MNPTNDPALRSWVPVPADSPFPIQNLPYGVFTRYNDHPRVCVAIGDEVLDLTLLQERGLLAGPGAHPFRSAGLDPLLALGRPAWGGVRARVSRLLRAQDREE